MSYDLLIYQIVASKSYLCLFFYFENRVLKVTYINSMVLSHFKSERAKYTHTRLKFLDVISFQPFSLVMTFQISNINYELLIAL